MYSPKGDILGFTAGGKVYLNGERLNSNTLVHEAAHIYLDWAEKNNEGLFNAGIAKIKNSKYLAKVKAKEFYKTEALKQGKEGSAAYERYMQKEALAHAIGDSGAQFFMETQRSSFRTWANKLWEAVGKYFGIKNKTPDEIRNMTLSEFTKGIAADILDPDSTFETQNQKESEPKVTPVDLNSVPRNTTGITHADTANILDSFGLEERDYSPQTVAEWSKEADKRLDNGELKEMMDKIKNGDGAPGPVEQIMLAKHIAELDRKASSTMNNKDIKELHDAIKLSDRIFGTEVARTMRARQIRFMPDGTLPSAIIEKMEALGVDRLTEEQKDSVKEQWDKQNAAKSKYDAAQKKARKRAEDKAMDEASKKGFASLKVSGNPKAGSVDSLKDRLRDLIKSAKKAPAFAINYAV
ncbi:MAG TPA: hypothetical protein VJ279_12770, partial [Hanamia sp.]|nr:hypothetical protein [Hanamia sp.]